MKENITFTVLIVIISAILTGQNVKADTVLMAVASNFNKTAKILAQEFEQQTLHKLVMSSGSTGKLYTQIRHRAPYDIFLSADADRPSMLAKQGLAIKESQFTYAVGQLVLLSSDNNLNPVNEKTLLKHDSFVKLAIANANIAPYGKAAMQTLQHFKNHKKLQHKIVRADNIMQTYMYIKSRNVSLGFVSKSLVKEHTVDAYWLVPSEFHSPIQQDAILLNKGKTNRAAHAFLQFLKSTQAQKIMENEGFISQSANKR